MNNSLNDFYRNFLEIQKKEKCFRFLKSIEKRQGQYVWFNGRKFIDFSSNDYLGFSQNISLKSESNNYLKKWGLGSSSSRLLSGNFTIHQELEQKICQWKGYEKALFFSSGYQANIGIVSSLADRNTVIFCDKLNHASLIDGIILSRAKLERYPHLDYAYLEKKLKTSIAKKKIIISESIFSMDGDKSNISTLSSLAKQYDSLLIIDDAHGSGIEKIDTSGVDVYMATFSKALGSLGAMVCTNELIYDYLVNICRSLIYTTAPPPFLIGQNMVAIKFIQSNMAEKLRKKLIENIKKIRNEVSQLGLSTISSNSAIIPIILGDESITMLAENILFKNKIFALGIRPPTVAKGMSRIRLVCQSLHNENDLTSLFRALKEISLIKNKG